MNLKSRNWIVRGGVAVGIVLAGFAAWHFSDRGALPEGIVAGNGRIEAIETDVAAKAPGRLLELLVDEGQTVAAGQLIARIDAANLQAQKSEAEARLQQALNAISTAEAQVAQRQSERAAAFAVVRQREAELNAARKRFVRSETLAQEGATSVQERDDDRARVEGVAAAVEAARAQLAAVEAAIGAARSQVIGARSNVDAARATIARLDVEIRDSNLVAPRAGRVQYRIAQPGEVIGAGGRVVNLVSLTDVDMIFFLPEALAGRVALGSEVRVVLDAAPDDVIPAKVTFVADVAQFTPKSVETESEREKLMFRVKARIDPAFLARHPRQVKSGLPGMAYVRLDPKTPWPDNLATLTTR
ncbi:MAG TPA: HlyD family efflux transporter periplasmic adaptor subunit [Novosphingobium sp.]|jgi:HlyD family secretion protein|nr:HlyD family efflux transporter periplasmic adaptor subunit [Novosphingobium sp.]